MKRLVDILVSATGLLVLAPFGVLVMIVIFAESPGSPLFLQQRVGRFGKKFTIFKFRTMLPDTDSVPTHMVNRDRILRTGHILRKYKIDEIPQLVNVLAGQMSLVGPRPCLPTQAELLEAREQLGVMTLRPGITGLAQIEGIDMSSPERLARKDAEYLQTATLAEDFRIMFQTVFRSSR